MKNFYLIVEDGEALFLTENLQELKQETKMKHRDDDSECFLIQVKDYQTLDLSFWELFIWEENSNESFEPAWEVLTEDDHCLLDKAYILSN